jgi:hypothetical protein
VAVRFVKTTGLTGRESTTRVTSLSMRSNVRLRDFALIEQFVLDYARYPDLHDRAHSRWALLRGRATNLAAQARMGRQPWESEWATAWRRRTAAEALVRIAKISSAASQIARQSPRSWRH